MNTNNTNRSTNLDDRLLSLDTLRGFDMLFIMGLAGLVTALCALFPGSFSDALAANMGHRSWDGLYHHDTIFPLFLFIAGISFPYSYAKQQRVGRTRRQIYRKIFVRAALLIVLGVVYNGLFRLNFPVRVASVLGRIGVAWALAALLFINLNATKRIIVAATILVGYSLLLLFVAAPDAPAGASSLSFEGNLVGYVDRLLLPGKILYRAPEGIVAQRGWFDPEGMLSVVPAVVTAMLGMFTGEFVRSRSVGGKPLSGNRKTVIMFVAAAVLLGIGLIWNQFMPINKKLWSSSFVCVVGAYSLAMFALFYYIVDVRGWRRWTLFFRVVGLNSITIYLAQAVVDFGGISDFFLGGVASKCSPLWASVVNSAGYLTVCWLMLYFLYRQRIFLKI